MAFTRLCLLAALFISQSLQDSKDPLKDFCRRWGHQTAQVDGKLYIDGGLVAWNPLSSKSLNYTNTWLLYSDLNSSTQDVGMPQQYANLTKDSNVPIVSGGTLWADEVNKCFYLFGGEFEGNPEDFSFWAYDTVLGKWNETTPETDDNSIQRVSFGAGTQIEELGRGYYYGGWINNHTAPGYAGPSFATGNLITFDFNDGSLKNTSGPDSVGRAEGSLVYLPASDGGLLVYFGGLEDHYRNGTVTGANMSTIHIFDVSSSKWYTQEAKGTIPPNRRQFCAGVTWADDHSSYNIYLYGGFAFGSDGYNISAFDDAYILSLPSFTWIKAWPADNSTTAFGHGGCSANVVNRDQLIIIGGWFPDTADQCDGPSGWGQHNMNMGYNGPAGSLWDKYDPKISKYFVPTPVISAVGGGPTGGATATSPTSWDNPDLPVYFTRVPSFSVRSATRTIPTNTATSTSKPTKSNVGAIAGGVVGGLVGLIVILSLILFCLHRRKKAQKEEAKQKSEAAPAPVELSTGSPRHEMESPGATKYMSMQQPDPSTHPAYSVHSRSPSDGRPQTSPYSPPQAYQATSPYDTEFSPVQHNYQQPYLPHSDNPNAQYNGHSFGQPSPPLHQQQYAYPSPITPIQPSQQYLQTQPQQVYYPPPSEHQHSKRSHPSTSDRVESPEGSGTQYSGETQTPMPRSTSNTPAHFYAQPVAVRARAGSGDGDGDSLGGGSIDSRRRPVKGRFVEVDHM